MTQCGQRNSYTFGLAIFCLAGAIAPSLLQPALAQITPDGTLGNQRSLVTPNQTIRGLPATLIEGGARRGANLFQSFSDFNVATGQRVYFANPAGVETILSRVTGNSASAILGTLGVNGSANLFLLNPNGILFGANARLDIAGSFVATTADSLDFGNGFKFSATNPQAPPLLTVSLRPGLQYGTNYQGTITNAGTLSVGNGQTLSLAGKSVSSTGSLIAPGGTVQLLGDRVSLLDNALIDVSGIGGGGTVLIGGDFQGKGQVPNARQTLVAAGVTINADGLSAPVSPNQQATPAPGGHVVVWSDGSTQFYGRISARGGALAGDGGAVEVSGKQTLDFNGHVDASALHGRMGSLLLDPNDYTVDASNVGAINGAIADMKLQAPNDISFNVPIAIQTFGVSLTAIAGNNISVNQPIQTNSGNITFTAGNDISVNQSIQTNSGNITFTAGNNISVNQPIQTNSGNVDLEAGNTLSVRHVDINTCPSKDCSKSAFIVLSGDKQVFVSDSNLLSRSQTSTPLSGDSLRAIAIVSSAGSVSLERTGISTTNYGTGDAGFIVITARDQVEIRDSINPEDRLSLPGIFSRGSNGNVIIGGSDLFPSFPTPKTIRISNSRINVDNDNGASAAGNAGAVYIRASESIVLENGTRISSSTFKTGDAGGVFLTTDPSGSIAINNDTVIFSNVENGGSGKGGDVSIDTGTFSLSNDSQLQALINGGGQGNAGLIYVNAADMVSISGNSSIFSTVEEGGTNTDFKKFAGGVFDALLGRSTAPITGSIFISTGSLVMDHGFLTASTGGQGNAGAVVVFARDQVALANGSVILSTVYNTGVGNAGGIIIGARNVLINNHSGLTTETKGQGNAGDILVFASDLISVKNNSAILSTVDEGLAQDAGTILLFSRSLHVQNASLISVDNNGSGLAGDVDISARGIWVDNFSTISAESKSGRGGNILLDTLAVILGRNSNISATSGVSDAGGTGGNIAIGLGNINNVNVLQGFNNRSLLIASQTPRDDNILAEAYSGSGGNIRINTFKLQDIARRSANFPTTNDISTKSQLGIDGTTVVNTLDLFPSVRSAPLPDRTEVPKIVEGCDPRARQETSRFIITGRGGLPDNPIEILNQDAIAPSQSASPRTTAPVPTAVPTAIVPARGWVKNADGSIRLTAYVTDPNAPLPSYPVWPTPASCSRP
jgi:filamentous hemagglutinin family protein